MGEHEAWGDVEDYWSLVCAIFCALVLVASGIDLALHYLHHFLEHHSGLHEKGGGAQVFHAYALRPGVIFFKIWTRLQTEMVVLGCLAFTLWVAAEYGFFEWARHKEGPEHGDEHSRRESEAEAEGEGGIERMCPRRWPPSGEVILEAAERIHFQLFMATVLYFACLALAFYMHLRRVRRFGEREIAAAMGQEPATDADRRVDRALRALRACVLSHCGSAGGVESLPDSREDPLSMRAYIQRTSKKNIEHLIAFPLSTWAIIVSLGLVLALSTRYLCFTGDHAMVAMKVWHLVVTVYLLGRIRLFWCGAERLAAAGRAAGSARLQDEPTRQVVQNTWPLPELDRVLCPLSAGVSGFLPHSATPSVRLAMSFTQATLWIEIFLLLVSTQYMSLSASGVAALVVWDVVELLTLAVFVCVVIPNMILIFSMPPFLIGEAAEYVAQVRRCFPDGFCPREDADLLQYGHHYQDSVKVEDEVEQAVQAAVSVAAVGVSQVRAHAKYVSRAVHNAASQAAHGMELGGGAVVAAGEKATHGLLHRHHGASTSSGDTKANAPAPCS